MAATQSPYEEHSDYVLSVLARRCAWLDGDDRQAAFHDAYAVLLEKQRDGAIEFESMHPHQLRAYLVQTAIHKALDEGKRAERKRTEALGDEPLLAEPDDARAPDDLAAANMDSARVREIVAELPERRQAIVKLRFFFDRTPEEIQSYLGITERAYRREIERALRHISERYELVREGSFCDGRRSVILAFVAGVAGPNRAQVAREHIESCPSCAHWAAELREATRRTAAMLPLPVVAVPQGRLERLAHAAMSVREHLVDTGTGAKQHAIALATRADPGSAGYATVARPGPVAAAVVGCIAVGGGASYCAVEGVPDAGRALVDRIAAPAAPQKQESTKPAPRRTASPPPPQVGRQPAPAAAPARSPRRAPAPAPRPQQQPAAQPSAADREFGIQATGPPTGGGAQPSAPAPTGPPQPPGEFDP